MTSLWLDRAARRATGSAGPAADRLPARPDVLVAGAGITGLATAVQLARRGLHVAVVEAMTIGAVTTGRSTAKLSLLQGTVLQDLLRHAGVRNAGAYVDANRDGAEWLLRLLDERDVPYERRDAVTYASSPDEVRAVDDEHRAARRLGLDARKVPDAGLPFETFGAVRLADQAQFDPVVVLEALAAELRAVGGSIVEGVRLTGVRAVTRGEGVLVHTTAGDLEAGRVVLATGTPVLDRGLYFAKVTAQRSSVAAYRVPGDRVAGLEPGMYLSAGSPTRSVRTAPMTAEDGTGGAPLASGNPRELLLIGGNGHGVGREPDTRARAADLHAWTRDRFPGAELLHQWSAQDYQSANRIPFVGTLPRSRGRVFVATGYGKWGMTNGVAAALRIAGEITDDPPAWVRVLGRRATRPISVGAGALENAEVGVAYAAGWFAAEITKVREPAEGEGIVTSRAGRPVAICRVGGVVREQSAICPHLAAVVSWNGAERSWDCPAHGSRFGADGALLEGPATRGLAEVSAPAHDATPAR